MLSMSIEFNLFCTFAETTYFLIEIEGAILLTGTFVLHEKQANEPIRVNSTEYLSFVIFV